MFKLKYALLAGLRACFYMLPATAQLTDQSDPELRSRGGQKFPPPEALSSSTPDSEATPGFLGSKYWRLDGLGGTGRGFNFRSPIDHRFKDLYRRKTLIM